jgi:hypothetical protein
MRYLLDTNINDLSTSTSAPTVQEPTQWQLFRRWSLAVRRTSFIWAVRRRSGVVDEMKRVCEQWP